MEISLSDYIAAGSLLVAFVALVKSFLSDRRVKRLDVLLKDKELQHHEADEGDMKKADVEVEVIETTPKKMNKLLFYNKGKANALNVNFEITSDTGADEITLNLNPGYLPYPKLLSFCKGYLAFYRPGGGEIIGLDSGMVYNMG